MSALTIFPLYAVAKRTFGAVVTVVSSWVWVILPSAWHAPIAYIVETSFTVFWLALLMWATLRLRSETRVPYWLGYGALWAFGALLNASLVALLPFFLGLAHLDFTAATGALMAIGECFYPDVWAAVDALDGSQFHDVRQIYSASFGTRLGAVGGE